LPLRPARPPTTPHSFAPTAQALGGSRQLDAHVHHQRRRFAGNYAEDIKDYDRVHEHIVRFADVLTSGINAQFPDKVKKS
jgi:hypothetical protein